MAEDTYNEDRSFVQVLFENGKDLKPSELNELQKIERARRRRSFEAANADSFNGDGFRVVENILDNVNKIKVLAGTGYLNGEIIRLKNDLIISGLTTPVSPRTDTVYVEAREVERTAVDFPDIGDPNVGQTATRIQLITSVHVAEGVAAPTSSIGNLESGGIKRIPIATLFRDANSSVVTAEIVDTRPLRELSGTGGGNAESALLLSLLSNNSMENIAQTSFLPSDENLVRHNDVLNMTLSSATHSYTPSSPASIVYWKGWRLPTVGRTEERWTLGVPSTGGYASTDGNGNLVIADVGTAANNRLFYTYQLPTGMDTGDLVLEFKFRTSIEGTHTAYDSDQSLYNQVVILDGSKEVRLTWIREGGSSGPRQLVVGSSAVFVANDIDTGLPLRIPVDFTAETDYKIYKKANILFIYINGEYKGRVDTNTLDSTVSNAVYWGIVNTDATTSTHVWNYFNLKAYRSALQTKVLSYRGTFAFEGDGNPTSLTSAGTIQELASNYFVEDNWVQWSGPDGSYAVTQGTTSAQNPGTLRAARRIELANINGYYYQKALTVTADDAANVALQAKIGFPLISLPNPDKFHILTVDIANHSIRLLANRLSNNRVEIGLANSSGLLSASAYIGSTVQIDQGETHVFEIRKIRNSTVHFLFDGIIQQEAQLSNANFNANPSTSKVYWGTITNLLSGSEVQLDYSNVRVVENKDSFLPRTPIKEFLAVIDSDDSEPLISFSSNGYIWTPPARFNDTGSSNLTSLPLSSSGTYPMARVLLSNNNVNSNLKSLAVLFNTSMGTGGLTSEFVKSFTAAELPSAPQNAAMVHGMGVASDEIMVFGGTEFLVKDLDWTYNSANSITIVNAQVGVPYTVRRVGFSFDRSQDNSNRIEQITNSIHDFLNVGLTSSVASNAMTITLRGNNGTNLSENNPAYINFKLNNGTSYTRKLTSNISLTIPSGATLGKRNVASNPTYIHISVADTTAGLKLVIASIMLPHDSKPRNTTAISASATSFETRYADAAYTNVPVRYVGYISQIQATAGVYANNASEIHVNPNLPEYGSPSEDFVLQVLVGGTNWVDGGVRSKISTQGKIVKISLAGYTSGNNSGVLRLQLPVTHVNINDWLGSTFNMAQPISATTGIQYVAIARIYGQNLIEFGEQGNGSSIDASRMDKVSTNPGWLIGSLSYDMESN